MFSKKRGDNMNRLKELREKKKLTLKELSQALKQDNVDISPDSLAKYERGERKPKYDKWVGIASFYGVSVPYLQGNTFSENDVFKIMSREYVSPSSDPFFGAEIDTHMYIIGKKDLSDSFTKNEIKGFTKDVKKFFEDNFKFVFLTTQGKKILMTEKSKKKDVINKVCFNFCDAVTFVDHNLIFTPFGNAFNNEVKAELDNFCESKDALFLDSSKTEVIEKTNSLIKALNKFVQTISNFPKDNSNKPEKETAKKRLKRFIDSGGKSFE